jgi:hypothetical protein
MKVVANRMAYGLAALLTLGVSRNAASQMADTTRTADTAKAVNVQRVTRTVYRSKRPIAPPAARRETRGAAPSARAVWVPGFWDLKGDRYTAPRAGWVWVPGRWLDPPVPHARWDPGHWGWYDEWYSWIPAHWVVPGPRGYPPDLSSDQSSQAEMSAP